MSTKTPWISPKPSNSSPNTNETFGPVDFLGLTAGTDFAPVRGGHDLYGF